MRLTHEIHQWALIMMAFLYSVELPAQLTEGVPGRNDKEIIPAKPEIFSSGFIDIMNSGQVNAAARFIRLLVGEPGKFCLPLSFYSGVSTNNFQNVGLAGGYRSNDILIANFINPLSGLANISVEGMIFFNSKARLTKTGLLYHTGERVLTGIRTGSINDPSTGKPHNFLNSFASLGFYFQTGAWERSNNRNIGICWFAIRYIACYSRPERLMEFMPAIQTNGIYYGHSLGWGVEINNIVNIKLLYYRYNKKPEIDYAVPIYQFSFNYTLKK